MELKSFTVTPAFEPALDPEFKPPILANRRFTENARDSGAAIPLALALERADGSISRFDTVVYDEDHPGAEHNVYYLNRILKFLLWSRGGWRVLIGGPRSIGQEIQHIYSPEGERSFDAQFMGRIYGKEFVIQPCDVGDVPLARETGSSLGGHLEGNRIGFDLGASDLKVSAVVDGEAIFSTEIEWQPTIQTDPAYHREHVQRALDLAASKLDRVDAIGGSSAGVYIDNRPMVASLFRGIPQDKYDAVQNMFLDIQQEMGVPLNIVNDGEVTALAGSMSLQEHAVLGVAMGSSEAAGYINPAGNVTGWLNELAFAPVDYNPRGPVDEWSRDRGVGASYFSQQCVFRLAPEVGIEIPQDLTKAQKLEHVQAFLEDGHQGAEKIWETMGIYLGYTIAHYAEFYDIKHLLILGRCTSGKGGPLMLEGANQVLASEFPDLHRSINLMLPDEKIRRVGQAIAAASLPRLGA